MSRRPMRPEHSAADALKRLRNIGPAAFADLAVLGIASITQLAASDPDRLYTLLQIKTGLKHDPCVRDVFAAAIHQARTGEFRDWWTFTQERKLRQPPDWAGTIGRHAAP
jgi:hypothetical protein